LQICSAAWTTPAEVALVDAIVASMTLHIEALAGLQKSLLGAAGQVGQNKS
jgi:hypothetical protein